MYKSSIQLLIILTLVPFFWLIVLSLGHRILKRNAIEISIKKLVLLFLGLNSFSLLGFASGWFVGLSKSPTVGTVMPAIFTFIAGFTIYLFSKEDTKEGFFNRVLTVIIIGAFSLWLIIGTEVGIKRRLNDEYLELHDNEVRSPESLEKKLEEMDFEELKKEFNGKSEEE